MKIENKIVFFCLIPVSAQVFALSSSSSVFRLVKILFFLTAAAFTPPSFFQLE